ncbi:MAG TPA: type I-E CRISPR-associated protein Cse2/CasB [Accumulibacter sp.]|nr:type I-E CRISPR-associated protein Cse2/CasB [Accumulibacter sp.]
MSVDKPDFMALWNRYLTLAAGDKAALRKVGEPDELREFHALYSLFPNGRAHDGWLRLAFLLPWCEDCGEERREKCPKLGKLLAAGDVNEMRLFQVARAKSPNDIIQFRRLMIRLKHPTLNWDEVASLLYRSEHRPSEPANTWAWSGKAKRQIVEDYYLAKFTPAKGDK